MDMELNYDLHDGYLEEILRGVNIELENEDWRQFYEKFGKDIVELEKYIKEIEDILSLDK